jgi:hypothetical protein
MIFDFDGTLTLLEVDWSELRTRLGIQKVSELWDTPNADAWGIVSDIETLAARESSLNEDLKGLLRSKFVVLSNNSEQAISEFIRKQSKSNHICSDHLIIGRETLAGPKEDPQIFQSAICSALRFLDRSAARTTYYGDQSYELEYAKSAGLNVVAVAQTATT